MKKISSIAGLSLKPEDPKWKQLAKIGATLIPHKPGVEREIINTLKEVRTTPRGRPRAYEIAAHCKEVLSGVDYIHNTLWLEHRTLNSDSILLSRDGSVKIGQPTKASPVNLAAHILGSKCRSLHA